MLTPELISKIETLPPCELEVFKFCGEGLLPAQISTITGRIKSIKTIESQINLTKKKLGLESNSILRVVATRYLVHLESISKFTSHKGW